MKNLFFFPIALLLLLMNSCGNPEGTTTTPPLPEPVLLRPTKATPEALAKAIAEIKATPEWAAQIETISKKEGITTDSAFFVHGTFIALQRPSKYGLLTHTPTSIAAKIESIKSTPEWFAGLQKEAAEKGKNIDELLTETANYVLDQELK